MNAALDLQDIRKRYGPTWVLDGVSLRVGEGEVHGLVGENGAGKSTLLKILSGVVSPDAGTLELQGRPVGFAGLSPMRAQSLGVSVVHQEFALLPAMTVAENIFLGREPRRRRRLDRGALRDGATEVLERLGSNIGPDERVEDLNVASAQVVEIAKALSQQARIIALDEPSAVLSGVELETLFGVVRNLKAAGVAVLYVSHRMDELFELCDRYTVLKDGKVAGSGDIADTDRPNLIRLMVGRDVAVAFPPTSAVTGPPRLEVRDLVVAGLAEPVSFSIRSGEVVGLAGLGGSGRSRLAKAVFGALPSSGTVLVDGQVVGPFASPAAAIDAGVVYLPEDRKQLGLALTKPVAANVTLLSLPRLKRGPLLSRTGERTRASELIARHAIRTATTGTDQTSALSGGNQQKVVFAKWLEAEPKVVILDEPTRGIDVGSKEQIYALIRQLAGRGTAFLLISSELVEVLGMSDRLLVMADASIRGELPAGSLEEDVMHVITASARRRTGGEP